MTAPDPGLTDLIAAHQLVSTDTIFHRNGMVQRPECKCGELMHWAGAYPAHLALVVEQHTNGRKTEPETTSEGGKRWYVNGYASVEFDAACDIWLNEVDPYVGDSGHARKLAAALHAAATAADELRAALEGEQQ